MLEIHIKDPNHDCAIIKQDWTKLCNDPLVSIRCVTFNHVNFIADAIEGFVMQKTNFPIEILVHDDASTDGTAEIIRKYQSEHPDLIRAVFRTENQHSKGIKGGHILFKMARGKYIALCDGDDYWTDPLKLQKQVDFMEAHPECSLCFHKVKCKGSDTKTQHYHLPAFNKSIIFDDAEIYLRNFIPTCSNLFRNLDLDTYLAEAKNLIIGDWPLNVYLSQHGYIAYINEIMGVYRYHDQGQWSNKSRITKAQVNLEVINYFKSSKLIKPQKEIYLALCRNYLKLINAYAQINDKVMVNKYLLKCTPIFPRLTHSFRREVVSTFGRVKFPKIYKIIKN